jgi:hypothetical protein
MEALAKASTLLAQIEAKLLKLAQRDPDHAAKLAEGLVEDFQNKLDLQRSELRIPSGAPLRNTISLPNLCSIVARKISACHRRWSAYGKLQGKGRRRGSPRSSTKSAPTCSKKRSSNSEKTPRPFTGRSRRMRFWLPIGLLHDGGNAWCALWSLLLHRAIHHNAARRSEIAYVLLKTDGYAVWVGDERGAKPEHVWRANLPLLFRSLLLCRRRQPCGDGPRECNGRSQSGCRYSLTNL